MLLLTPVGYSAENSGKICVHIAERGAETVIIGYR